jgi:hypothetical protein
MVLQPRRQQSSKNKGLHSNHSETTEKLVTRTGSSSMSQKQNANISNGKIQALQDRGKCACQNRAGLLLLYM